MAEKVRLDADFFYRARDLIGSQTEINSLVYSVRNSYGKGFEPNQEPTVRPNWCAPHNYFNLVALTLR